MLTIVRNLSRISSSDIFLRLWAVPLAGVAVEELTDVDVTVDDTGETTGIAAFLFLSNTGEKGTVPLAVLVIGSATSSSTGFVY